MPCSQMVRQMTAWYMGEKREKKKKKNQLGRYQKAIFVLYKT